MRLTAACSGGVVPSQADGGTMWCVLRAKPAGAYVVVYIKG
jgi:hypothetical protein